MFAGNCLTVVCVDIVLLKETAQPAKKAANGRWRAILAVPGQGSSGFYPAETLKQYGPIAFPAGTKSYINHDWKRDPRDIFGHYPEGAFWDPEEGAEGALVAELEVRPSLRDLAEELAPLAGMSIFSMGKVNEVGQVTELIFDRTNSVDLVGEAGLEGSGLDGKISESALALLEQARTAASAVDREEESMTPEEMKALLAEALAPVVAFVSEQKQAAEAADKADKAEADKAPSVKEAVEAYAAASKAIVEAKLLPTQEASLLKRAAEGEDISAALEEAKTIKDEASTALTESASAGGRRIDGDADKGSYGLGMFR